MDIKPKTDYIYSHQLIALISISKKVTSSWNLSVHFDKRYYVD